jgi:deoxyribose-phosphate aldolase
MRGRIDAMTSTANDHSARVATARRAIALVDLTELGDAATAADVTALCARASTADGTVAAVCVWPRFVVTARTALADTPVRIATVVNFPSGSEAPRDVVHQTVQALADGADEIDVVLPHRAFAAGDVAAATQLLDAVRAAVPRDTGALLKVILETGELHDLDLVEAAARTAIAHGADFIKTSTGKTATSASLSATEVMLRVIRDTDPRVGLKPSGGIRTLDDAAAYLGQADAIMGTGWVSPRTFRFGASGLLTALTAALHDTSPAADTETGY